MRLKTVIAIIFVLSLPIFLSGCALLEIPGMLIGGTFKILGEIIRTAGKLPTPPPWIF